MNNETLYTTSEAIKELNHVEGFEPMNFIRKIKDETDPENAPAKCYLDVVYRKLWFRLKHPQGAIKKFVREITDQFAIVEARVYLDRNDPPDSYIANAIVKKYFSPDDRLGDKYLETAETAATGRALSDAGFGIQFADGIEPLDQNVVDAPINSAVPNKKTGEVTDVTETELVQNQITDIESAPVKPTLTRDMPVEQLMSLMTLDDAVNVVIDNGVYSGKTLEQIAREKPQGIEWYATAYKGSNNLIRAGARIILNSAKK